MRASIGMLDSPKSMRSFVCNIQYSRSLSPFIFLQATAYVRGTGHQVIPVNDISYAEPVLRPNTPNEPFSTGRSLDETTQAEQERGLSSVKFSSHVESMHRFRVEREAELVAEQSPSLPSLREEESRGQ